MIEKLQAHYGFSRMPFGRDLAPGMLHRHASHNEAVARISWCISERSIGVVTGEVGAGKTVSVRTVLASLDPSRHTVIYLPNPLIGVRGIHEEIVNAFGQPTLRRTMKLAVLAALEQRTALRYTMPPMTAAETTSYVAHHLKLAGRADQLFTEDALNLIHTTARGYPRAVNNLALQSLVAAFASGKNLVDEPAARSAVTEVVD